MGNAKQPASLKKPDGSKIQIAIIGLGYVGLPLAAAFGKYFATHGFDINHDRILALEKGVDATREVTPAELSAAKHLHLTADPADLKQCNTYIVTVPTPVDGHKRPNLTPLIEASRTVGALLNSGDYVIYESTVYPGATEEVCVPILEQNSGLRFNEDFYVGYSPERINPGDRTHRLKDIVKVTSGSTPKAADFVDALYKTIVEAGTHRTETIREAEAAKVIENTQRDVNIALVNELATLFNKLGIDTGHVLEAAATKWNFLKFSPGLVGGHCIGVDPYYLTHKAKEVNYIPEVILSGRRINDDMGSYVANRVVKLLTQRRIHVVGSQVLVMGLAFKPNCPDIRNTRVIDIVREFQSYSAHVDVYDPWVDPDEARKVYKLEVLPKPNGGRYDAIILAVEHDEFLQLQDADYRSMCKDQHVIYDVKRVLPRELVTERL